MKTPIKILIVFTVAAAVVAAVALKKNKVSMKPDANAPAATVVSNQTASVPVANAKLPKLLDLGAGKC